MHSLPRRVCHTLASALAVTSTTWAAGPTATGPNLVANGNFEEGRKGWSSTTRVVTDSVKEGKQAIMLDNSAGKDWVAVVQQFVPLKPRTYYEFSMVARRTNGQGYVYARLDWMGSPGRRLMSSENWSAGRATPVTIRTGEGTGRWQTFSGTFRCNRPDLAGGRLVIWIANGADTVYVDDVQVRELRYPDAPDWDLGTAVAFPGRPSTFGMRVESVKEQDGTFTVRTTGAEYVLNHTTGSMACRQRIGVERLVATLTFPTPLPKLKLVTQTADVAIFVGDSIALEFQGDSLVTVATNRDLETTLASNIGCTYYRSVDPHVLALDDDGGFSLVTHARPRLESAGSAITRNPEQTQRPGWAVAHRVAAREMLALAVCPARPYDWERSFTKRIVCVNKFPPEDALKAYAEHANVLFYFAGPLYRQHDPGHTHAPYEVKDPSALRAAIKLAHDHGMEVICYRHPTSYVWAEIPMEDAIADMKQFRKEYGFDGWYFDGLYYNGQWLETYRFIRAMRDDVGANGIIYTHCTLNPPLRQCELYCPFIDSYSDFLLRGEGQTIRGPRDPYLRYVINTYKISNAIATLKGDQMLREGAETPKPTTGKPLSAQEKREAWKQVGSPIREQLDVMLRLNGRCRWAYPGWPLRKHDQEDYVDFYFKELERMQTQWKRSSKPPPIRWP
ncbi:MAG: hypothetical protein HN742_12465 [Lentisphaerae bacterium]|jgi:hypothetical protein|nr:hypothetical protein [Lentisphaerota bacterium]MBT4822152.1 hypothetical protein [Lentisphaerota bacterium]MBT5605634.1 hypothetical protein [Lentisphaerota bacterium]MBT7054438.1 hypothetical protein [Lentisphaerota bacterium]MBT7842682.1 hypothetical protein [Lentisphaerota bacterium]